MIAAILERLRGQRGVGLVEFLRLGTDATLRIAPGRGGLVVRCDAGTVLVTQEGDGVDHVLLPGHELLAARRGVVVAWALSEAVLTVARPRLRRRASARERAEAPAAAAPAGGWTCMDPRAPPPA